MHISHRSETAVIRNIDNGFNAKRIAFGKKYALDLGEGRIVFVDQPVTAEEYREAQRKEIEAKVTAARERRQQNVWKQAADSLASKRVPLFDRSKIAGQDKLSMLIRNEMNKMQEVK